MTIKNKIKNKTSGERKMKYEKKITKQRKGKEIPSK